MRSLSFVIALGLALSAGIATGISPIPFFSGNAANAAWNVSAATYVRSFSIAAQEGFAQAVFFKPDGLKMYTNGSVNDRIYEYDLSTAWDVSTAVFLQSLHVGLDDASPTGLFFKPDGTKMYYAGNNNDEILEYDLGTPWDVSTAAFLQMSTVVAARGSVQTTGVFFSSDGTRMFTSGADTDSVHQFTVATPWDVSTASFVRSFTVTEDGFPNDVFFKPDGTRMYVAGAVNAAIFEYALGTAWDISTATLTTSKSVAAQDAAPGTAGLYIRADGVRMYVCGTTNDAIYEYHF